MSGFKRQLPWTDEQEMVPVKKRGVGGAVPQHPGIAAESNFTMSAPPQGLDQGENADEVDPLDAFMAEIDQQVEANIPNPHRGTEGIECDEEADPAAEFMEARRTGAISVAVAMENGYNSDEDVYATAKATDGGVDMEYDSDDNPIIKKKIIEGLPPLDHSSIEYQDFDKDFYTISKELSAMTPEKVSSVLKEHQLKIAGFDTPRPVQTFKQCGFGPGLMSAIKKQRFTQPTPIQMAALPASMSGRDILGVAKTGSGKTAAFVLPMIVHILAQPEILEGEGPIAVIVAPTRELAEQIHKQARIFGKPYEMKISACFGGLSKRDQLKELRQGVEVMVGTPGRIIDLIKMKACSMQRATYLVFDEADRMFDMGFEHQIRSIMGQIRPDRQTMLFSATMPPRVEKLAQDALSSPVRITVGAIGAANEDIRQSVSILANDTLKFNWLIQRLERFVDDGDVLIFGNLKARVENIVEVLKAKGYRSDGVHGDMDQFTRMDVMKRFREGKIHVLVATDVAARGLDIRSVKTVINFDAAKDIESHVHRIGRTGRAGDKDGTAFTLVTPKEARFAAKLVQSLTTAGQEVAQELYDLAMKDGQFKKNSKRGKGTKSEKRRPQVGGAGLGFSSSLSNTGGTSYGAQAPSMTFAKASDPQNSSKSQVHMVLPAKSMAGDIKQHEPSKPVRQDDSLRSYHEGMFRSQFIKSGTTGGDLSASPVVVAPKVASSRPVPPPPTPVTEKPIVKSSYPLQPPSRVVIKPVVTKTPEFSAAFAAAQAIAARLASGESNSSHVEQFPTKGPDNHM